MKITVTFDSLEEFQAACIIGQQSEGIFKQPHTAEEIQESFEKEEKKEEKKEEAPDKPLKAEDVRAKLNEVVKAKGKEAVKELFKSFGAANFTKIKPEDYGALLEAAEEVLAND